MSKTSLPLSIELALLGFPRQKPMHGYEIYQQMSSGLGLVWPLGRSQLYALLLKLKQAGYLACSLEKCEARPPRKIYRLTDAGCQAFQEWLHQPVKFTWELRQDFLAKLYFAQLEGPASALRLIEAQRMACRGWLVEQRQGLERSRQTHTYDWLADELRLGQIKAMLVWLDTCQKAALFTIISS